jgi:cell division protein FtsQ
MGAVAARIEAFPGVAAVDVQRELPGTVVIRVTERSAAVLLDGTRGLAADATGIVFARRTSSGIPVLAGWRGVARPGAVLDPASRAVVASLASFPQALLRRVRRITLFGSVTIVLDDGTEVRFGQPTELPAKARAADAVLAVEADRKLAYVDVRAPSAPASRDRTPPSSASPSPSPQAR